VSSDLDPRNLHPAVTGHRNGLPGTGADWKPYVRNPAIKAREAEIDARLAALRARIQSGIDAENA
jgi:hypothetical protein